MARTATAQKAKPVASQAPAQATFPAVQDKEAHPMAKLREQLESRVDDLRTALPPHIPADRFIRVVLTAVQNNTDLLAADRQSLWNSCMRAAQDGLLPDGREGAIVIYNTKVPGSDRWIKKAQWMPMVFGVLKKVRNSGELAMITARVVYGGDKYRHWLDDDGEHILYEPAEAPDKNLVRAIFAAAKTKDGELLVEPLTPHDIEKIRSISRAKDKGPWVDWWEEMAKKSAIRRLSKRLPMSSDLDDLIRRDDDLYDLSAQPTDPVATLPKRAATLGAAFDHFAGAGQAARTGISDAAVRQDGANTGGAGPAADDLSDGGVHSQDDAGHRSAGEEAPHIPADQASPAADRQDKQAGKPWEGEGWTPANSDAGRAEYVAYARAHIEAETHLAALQPWLMSDAELALRKACSLAGDDFGLVKAALAARVEQLRKA